MQWHRENWNEIFIQICMQFRRTIIFSYVQPLYWSYFRPFRIAMCNLILSIFIFHLLIFIFHLLIFIFHLLFFHFSRCLQLQLKTCLRFLDLSSIEKKKSEQISLQVPAGIEPWTSRFLRELSTSRPTRQVISNPRSKFYLMLQEIFIHNKRMIFRVKMVYSRIKMQ